MLHDPGIGHDTLIEGTREGSLWCQGVVNGHHWGVQLARPDTEVGLRMKERTEKKKGEKGKTWERGMGERRGREGRGEEGKGRSEGRSASEKGGDGRERGRKRKEGDGKRWRE